MTNPDQDKNPNQPIVNRPNYFPGRYLLDDDFKLEQRYHIDRHRRHNRLLHVSGIVEGLGVRLQQNSSSKVYVSPGSAIDSQGREIIVLEETLVDCEGILYRETANSQEIRDVDNIEYDLWIEYGEEGTKHESQSLSATISHIQEKPTFKSTKRQVSENNIEKFNKEKIHIAKIKRDGRLGESPEYSIVKPDTDICWERQYSGICLPVLDGKGITLRSNGSSEEKSAILNSSLTIDGSLNIGKKDTRITLRSNGSSEEKSAILNSSLTIDGSLNIGEKETGITLKVDQATPQKLSILSARDDKKEDLTIDVHGKLKVKDITLFSDMEAIVKVKKPYFQQIKVDCAALISQNDKDEAIAGTYKKPLGHKGEGFPCLTGIEGIQGLDEWAKIILENDQWMLQVKSNNCKLIVHVLFLKMYLV